MSTENATVSAPAEPFVMPFSQAVLVCMALFCFSGCEQQKTVTDVTRTRYEYLDISLHDLNFAVIRRYTVVEAVAGDGTVVRCGPSVAIGDSLKGDWREPSSRREPKAKGSKSDGTFNGVPHRRYTTQRWIRGQQPEKEIVRE